MAMLRAGIAVCRRPPLLRRPTQKTPARAATTKATAKKKAYSASTARARRAQLARARAAARARELKELQTPRFRVDEFGREVPDVRAEAAIIYNPETGEVLWENHSKDQRSMASITKVMTALVFLESNTPLSTHGHGAAQRRVARLDDLSAQRLQADRRRSAEPAARSAPTTPPPARWRASSFLGYDGFIQRMNEKAKELGPREHRLCGSVGPARREPVVGLRPGALDCLCRGG